LFAQFPLTKRARQNDDNASWLKIMGLHEAILTGQYRQEYPQKRGGARKRKNELDEPTKAPRDVNGHPLSTLSEQGQLFVCKQYFSRFNYFRPGLTPFT
jgi:hypothetical protein